MTYRIALALAGLGLAAASPALAQDADAPRFGPALGADTFISSDAEGTEVHKVGLDLHWRYEGVESYQGIRVERARFNPQDQGWEEHDRVYFQAADKSGAWNWAARVGTDDDTVLGAASIHNDAPLRQEFFIERDIVETPRGVREGIYHTFIGAALDVPIDDRNTATFVAGAQEFTGQNLRRHLRANFIHVISPDLGLSGQLRTRYFDNTHPREKDYYSPRWYAQVLPVVQLRRFSGGWRYAAAVGLGVQRDSDSDWSASRYADIRITSPVTQRDWAFSLGATYTNTSLSGGPGYSYVQFNLGLTRAF